MQKISPRIQSDARIMGGSCSSHHAQIIVHLGVRRRRRRILHRNAVINAVVERVRRRGGAVGRGRRGHSVARGDRRDGRRVDVGPLVGIVDGRPDRLCGASGNVRRRHHLSRRRCRAHALARDVRRRLDRRKVARGVCRISNSGHGGRIRWRRVHGRGRDGLGILFFFATIVVPQANAA